MNRPAFAARTVLDQEVMAYHRDHQLAEPGCIAATARTLRRHVDTHRLDGVLAQMPDGAGAFWSGKHQSD